jgi:hypothetical protein
MVSGCVCINISYSIQNLCSIRQWNEGEALPTREHICKVSRELKVKPSMTKGLLARMGAEDALDEGYIVS